MRTLVFGGAGLALACATSSTADGGRSTSLTMTDTPTIVKAKVDATGKVDQEEIRLSKSGGHQVHWDVEGADSLAIVPDDPATWPLDVKCEGGHCEGTVKADAEVGKRHSYHTEVGNKAGEDPVLIIDG